MNKLSRRQLSDYAVSELLKGTPPEVVSSRLVAELQLSGRTTQYQLLIDDIYQKLESDKLLSRARVSSARPISQSTKRLINGLVSAQTGSKEVELIETQDKSLIGGLRISTPSFSWDNTVSNRLNRLVSEKRI